MRASSDILDPTELTELQQPVINSQHFDLIIPTDDIGEYQFAIYGEALGSNSAITEMFLVSVIPRPIDNSSFNMAPFFDKEPQDNYFDLNSKNIRIELPEILDSY